jgi:hypothetical protein
MNMWRVGEDMGSKETDRCPLTDASSKLSLNNSPYVFVYTWRNREVTLHPWGMGDDREINRWKEISPETTSLFLTPGGA